MSLLSLVRRPRRLRGTGGSGDENDGCRHTRKSCRFDSKKFTGAEGTWRILHKGELIFDVTFDN